MKDLTKLSTEELEKKLKSHKLINGLLIGIVLVLAILETKKYLESNQFEFAMVMPIIFFAGILVNFKNQKKMEQELATRN